MIHLILILLSFCHTQFSLWRPEDRTLLIHDNLWPLTIRHQLSFPSSANRHCMLHIVPLSVAADKISSSRAQLEQKALHFARPAGRPGSVSGQSTGTGTNPVGTYVTASAQFGNLGALRHPLTDPHLCSSAVRRTRAHKPQPWHNLHPSTPSTTYEEKTTPSMTQEPAQVHRHCLLWISLPYRSPPMTYHYAQ